MFEAKDTDFIVPFDGSFSIDAARTKPPNGASAPSKEALAAQVERIAEAQRVLFAADSYAVLLVFQAMDAAGKDGTIRAVMSGVNPAGCQVVSFKEPGRRALDHDFLWRTTALLPERGRIGVFNRSHYEEVLVVRVHSEILYQQKLPPEQINSEIWDQRLSSIRDHEHHLARNGVVILKFFLHVSRDEQRRRFLKRLENPDKHWKFSVSDVTESNFWPEYMKAYDAALNATSRSWAPWYVIPADDKPFMRYQVAETVADAIESLGLTYPKPDDRTLAEFKEYREKLMAADKG